MLKTAKFFGLVFALLLINAVSADAQMQTVFSLEEDLKKEAKIPADIIAIAARLPSVNVTD